MIAKPGMRWCSYCKCDREEKTFVDVLDKRGLRRNRKCGECVKIGKLSKKARDARGARLALERRSKDAKAQQELKQDRIEKQKERQLEKAYESKAADQ